MSVHGMRKLAAAAAPFHLLRNMGPSGIRDSRFIIGLLGFRGWVLKDLRSRALGLRVSPPNQDGHPKAI